MIGTEPRQPLDAPWTSATDVGTSARRYAGIAVRGRFAAEPAPPGNFRGLCTASREPRVDDELGLRLRESDHDIRDSDVLATVAAGACR